MESARGKIADKLEKSIIRDFKNMSVARRRSEMPSTVNSDVESKISELAEKK